MGRALAVLLAACLSAAGAGACVNQRSLRVPDAASTGGGAAKFHMKDGGVYYLSSWTQGGGVVRGVGARYDANRAKVGEGALELPLGQVVVVETQSTTAVAGSIAFMLVVTGASVGLTVACATDPKMCFGSCPTFYVPGDVTNAHGGGGWAIQAEGFSTSIARAFEATDVDDLPAARPVDGALTMLMRNEALETQAVRGVALLVVDGPAGSAVAQRTSGGYLATTPPIGAAACDDAGAMAGERQTVDSCARLAAADGDELALSTDGVDLGARTSLTLHWPAPGQARVALALSARNSLLTTYLLYELLALHGREAGALFAAVERRAPDVLAGLAAWKRALGGVDVAVRQGRGAWREVGGFDYVGPIATETRALPFTVDDPAAPLEVRLTFARGDWRLDAARLGVVVAEDLPAVRVAADVVDAGRLDAGEVATGLRGEGARVVTFPGDTVTLRFALPAVADAAATRAYFVESRGYYYEWIRREWLADEDLPRAARYLRDPARALRELAASYQAGEARMRDVFEHSRFGRVVEAPQ